MPGNLITGRHIQAEAAAESGVPAQPALGLLTDRVLNKLTPLQMTGQSTTAARIIASLTLRSEDVSKGAAASAAAAAAVAALRKRRPLTCKIL
eukprot:1159797-Pelagomonas_calceolata.AAC.2